ncbi:MAG: acetolactate synthase large subunit [Betaproteobacteria bacterium]|nr:acetolactate synthase large subunit [Betaproteobacteria bacterium]
MNGADDLVHTLLAGGVEVCFTNPGTSEMHFVAALDRIDRMRCVLGLFEGVVTGAADGYYRIAGKPAATLLHLGPGLGNGLANLHNARRARSGIVNIVGDHATDHLANDSPLTSDLEGIARTVSHWVRTTRSAGTLRTDALAAIDAACSPPGQIATLALPADAAWGELPAHQAPLAPDSMRPAIAYRPLDAAAVTAAAQALLEPETLLLLGAGALDEPALEQAGRIAARTGCALMTEFYTAKLSRGAGRVVAPRLPYAVEPTVAALARFKRIVLVGARAPIAFFAYPGKPRRLAPAGCALITLTEPEHDAHAALAALAAELDASALAPAHVAARQTLSPSALPAGRPNSDGIAAVLSALLPEHAIVVDEAVTTGRSFGPSTVGAAPHDWLSVMGGSIGFALPCAVGAAIAAPARKVVALEGDGSAMYTIQALWTMAREQLDVTVVIMANRAYQILRGEFAGVGAGTPGRRATDMLTLDRPTLDFVSIARGMGLEAARAEDLGEFARLFGRAMSQTGPVLIELVIG